jgi:hypothetical protein
VEADGVVVAPIHGPAESNTTEKLAADTVVVISNNRPNRALYEELKARGMEAHVAGDANSPRFLAYETLEGHRAGAAV